MWTEGNTRRGEKLKKCPVLTPKKQEAQLMLTNPRDATSKMA